ncbi:hypothetical protein WJ978_22850 [Achromobacter xylosoxidans]
MKIRKNLEPSPIPNQTTVSGISAILGSGRRNCTKGSSTAERAGDMPISRPSGTPITMAAANATPARATLVAVCSHKEVC